MSGYNQNIGYDHMMMGGGQQAYTPYAPENVGMQSNYVANPYLVEDKMRRIP